jgi:hypothetical protein
VRRTFNVDRQHVLVWLWFFQVSKLTAQKRCRHKMTASPLKMFRNPCSTRAQKDNLHFFVHTQALSIRPFQGRARDNGIFVCGETTFN